MVWIINFYFVLISALNEHVREKSFAVVKSPQNCNISNELRLCHQLYHVFIWVVSFISNFWIYLIEFILRWLDDWLSNRLVIFFLNNRLDVLPKNLSGIRVILLVFMQNNLHILIFIFLDLNYLVILILLIQ